MPRNQRYQRTEQTILSVVSWHIHIVFDSQISLPDAMCFVPMQLYSAHCAIRQANRSGPFQLAPSSATIRLAKVREHANAWPCSKNLHIGNGANDLKLHCSA